jgi:hypothetical protein
MLGTEVPEGGNPADAASRLRGVSSIGVLREGPLHAAGKAMLAAARPHVSGGDVIERAAILAEGGDFTAVIAWIISRAGEPESAAASASTRGLHGSRLSGGRDASTRPPLRFVLPAGTLR